MKWKVPKIWEGATCFIVGGGSSLPKQFGVPEEVIGNVISRRERPSAYSKYLKPLHNKHVIGVNNAYQIGSWIDALFFGDCSWYLVHKNSLSKWPGLKVTCCPRFESRSKKESESIKFLKKDSRRWGLSNNPSTVCWNSNSGAAAISLAVHFGAKRIVLLGFDMNMEGVTSHWHGSHGHPGDKVKKPPFKRHLRGFPAIAEEAKQKGVEILNANLNSTIDVFQKVTLEDVL